MYIFVFNIYDALPYDICLKNYHNYILVFCNKVKNNIISLNIKIISKKKVKFK